MAFIVVSLQDVLSAIHDIEQQKKISIPEPVRAILAVNLERGRIQKQLDGNYQPGLHDYIEVVNATYEQYAGYLHQVQVAKSLDAWQPLITKLRSWAYPYLGRWNLEDETRVRLTMELADLAGGELANAHFPYDVDFEPWACVLLQNICRKHMTRMFRPSQVPQASLVDISELDERLSQESRTYDKLVEIKVGQKADLLQAIEELSDRRRQIIIMHYFEGMKLAEIAKLLQLSPATVHKRHFDALAQLRRLL